MEQIDISLLSLLLQENLKEQHFSLRLHKTNDLLCQRVSLKQCIPMSVMLQEWIFLEQRILFSGVFCFSFISSSRIFFFYFHEYVGHNAFTDNFRAHP